MLHRAMQELKGDPIEAQDGEIGSVYDLFFDDEQWAVRYLVVDTGNWLSGHKVLISPASVAHQGRRVPAIRVDLRREQVERAPGIDAHPPVSRLLEEAHARYYGHPFYWAGPYLWGPAPMPLATAPVNSPEYHELRQSAEKQAQASHVRSSAEVVGYRMRAEDGDLGQVQDFLVDDESWAIAGVVVDTRPWLPGQKVVVPPTAIAAVDWHNREVVVRRRRAALERLQ